MKRFYKTATIEGSDGRFQVLLDGKSVRTPARSPHVLPTEALAGAIACEWNAVEDEIRADDMPVTKLANSVTDLMPQRRHVAVAETAAFAETDLLCYRATAPADLVARQTAAWQPWLVWCAGHHGIELEATAGMTPIAQPPAALSRVQEVITGLDDWRLVAIHSATQITGSLILALALLEKKLAASEAHAASLLDEQYTIEVWGQEIEQATRHRNLARDLEGVAVFLEALRQGD